MPSAIRTLRGEFWPETIIAEGKFAYVFFGLPDGSDIRLHGLKSDIDAAILARADTIRVFGPAGLIPSLIDFERLALSRIACSGCGIMVQDHRVDGDGRCPGCQFEMMDARHSFLSAVMPGRPPIRSGLIDGGMTDFEPVEMEIVEEEKS